MELEMECKDQTTSKAVAGRRMASDQLEACQGGLGPSLVATSSTLIGCSAVSGYNYNNNTCRGHRKLGNHSNQNIYMFTSGCHYSQALCR